MHRVSLAATVAVVLAFATLVAASTSAGLAGVFARSNRAVDEAVRVDPRRVPKFDAANAANVSFKHFDGVARVVNPDGSLQFNGAYGETNAEYNVPMTEDAQFPVGSNTKLYTAVAIYQLQERGLLSVDEDVANYLNASDFAKMGLPETTAYCPKLLNSSESAASCQRMTLRDLLSMSSGIYAEMHCIGPSAFHVFCNPAPYIIYPGSVALMVRNFIELPLEFVPGTAYSYSNPNFIFAAYFIEKFSGLTFGEYVTQNIIEPAGLTSTYFTQYNQQFKMNKRRVGEYHRFVDKHTDELLQTGATTVDFDMGSMNGAGGIISTQQDEHRFYMALFANVAANGATYASKLLNATSLRQLIYPTTAMPAAVLPTYFAQGVLVTCAAGSTAASCSADGPEFLLYQGGTLQVYTVNILDLRAGATTQNLMTQVYQSSFVYNTTRADIDAATTQGGANYFAITEAMLTTTPTIVRAWSLHNAFAPQP